MSGPELKAIPLSELKMGSIEPLQGAALATQIEGAVNQDGPLQGAVEFDEVEPPEEECQDCSKRQPPPGQGGQAIVDQVLNPREAVQQEMPMSCALGCARMILQDHGENISEIRLRVETSRDFTTAYNPVRGTSIRALPGLLQSHGVRADPAESFWAWVPAAGPVRPGGAPPGGWQIQPGPAFQRIELATIRGPVIVLFTVDTNVGDRKSVV